MDPLVWAGLLLGLGLLLVLSEFFIPSGGIIGVLAALAIITGITLAFYHRGAAVGFAFLMAAICSVPAILLVGFKVLPLTPIGKLLIAQHPDSEEVLSDIATRRHLRDWIGWIGRTTTPMLPSGSIEVAGEILDAVSQGMAIDANTPIKIVDVQGTRIIVRPCLNEELAVEPENPQAPHRKSAEQVAAADDLLSQPLESLGIDSWESPLSSGEKGRLPE